MKQVGLIFWRDLRHMWPELCVYAALLAAFAMAAPQIRPGMSPNSFQAMFVTLLKILLPASWLVLIVRVVHADRLVGEEQFWITRPYHWASMLGAKMMFLLTCMVLPLMVMQWEMLLAVGLNPFAQKAGMGLLFLRFFLAAVLPYMIIASVTDSLTKAFLSIVAVLIVFAGSMQFILSGPEMNLRASPPHELALFCSLFGGLMVTILIYQYARRRTLYSRIAIAATLVLFLLMIFGYDRVGFGAPIKALIRHSYPLAEHGSPSLVFAPGQIPYDERAEDLQVPRGYIEVKLPLRVEGLPSDGKLRDTQIYFTLKDGATEYSSPWQETVVGEYTLGLLMPQDVFRHFANVGATIHVELAAGELRLARVEHMVAADEFGGPMRGVCALAGGKVTCRYAYREWTPVRVEALAQKGECGVEGTKTAVAATLRRVAAGTTFDPVVSEALPLAGNVCAGAPVSFSEFAGVGNVRLVLDVPVVKIAEYRSR